MRYTNLGLVSITLKGAIMRMLIVALMLCCATAFAQTSLEQELQQLEEGVRGARSVAEQESYAPQLSDLGAQAFDADEYDVAVKAYDYAQRIARSTRPADAAEYARRMHEAKAAAREYAKVKRYVGQDDAASKRKVAEFGAFVKREWETALPDLAEGDDAIAQAAQLDMRHLGGEEAEAVAYAWVEAARRNPPHAAALYLRAGVLYDEAAGTVPTAELLNKMIRFGSRIGYETAPPKGAVRVKGDKYTFTIGLACSSGDTLDLAFDGKMATGVQIQQGPTAWIAVDLGVSRRLSRIIYAPIDSRKYAADWFERNSARMVGAVIQVSNSPDFKYATTVHTITEPPPQLRLTVIDVSTPGVWRYVRYVARPDDKVAIGEFDVY